MISPGIQITYWPLRAWYTPDAAVVHRWQGRTLLFTANEGADKNYGGVAEFEETIRGKDILTSGERFLLK